MRTHTTLTLLALACCTCKRGQAVVDAGSVPARATSVSILEPIFDDDDAHPWNRVHAALFSRQRSIGVPPCALSDAGCLELSPGELHRAPFVSKTVHEGGDDLLAFIGGEVDFLANAARRDEALAALGAAMKVDASAHPVAAALLQGDLWERFDALGEALALESTPGREFLQPLRAPLAKLIGKLALPEAMLTALPANHAEVGRAFPELLPGWGGPEWVEVRSEFTKRPGDATWHTGTRHAERWGHRAAFKVLARVPPEAGGADWLRANLSVTTAMPEGTILALVGMPLALSREGTLVPLPLVTLVELRKARAQAATTVGTLPFDVLEGKRALLAASTRPTGGLVHLGRQTLIPIGATCMPDRTSRKPLRGACAMCHGGNATRLTGPLEHGGLRLVPEADPAAAGREVARVKGSSAELRALRDAW